MPSEFAKKLAEARKRQAEKVRKYGDLKLQTDISHLLDLTVHEGDDLSGAVERIKKYISAYASSKEKKSEDKILKFANLVENISPLKSSAAVQADKVETGQTVLFGSGWQEHHISMIIKPGDKYDYIALVNRGYGVHKDGTTIFCRINKGVINKNYLTKIHNCVHAGDKETWFELQNKITGENNENIIGAINQSRQKKGICTWTNYKAAYLAQMVIEENFSKFESLPDPTPLPELSANFFERMLMGEDITPAEPSILKSNSLITDEIKEEYDQFALFTRKLAEKLLHEIHPDVRNEYYSAILIEHLYSDNPFNKKLINTIKEEIFMEPKSLSSVITNLIDKAEEYSLEEKREQSYLARNIIVLCQLNEEISSSDIEGKEEKNLLIGNSLQNFASNAGLTEDINDFLSILLPMYLESKHSSIKDIENKLSYLELLENNGFRIKDTTVDALLSVANSPDCSPDTRITILHWKKTYDVRKNSSKAPVPIKFTADFFEQALMKNEHPALNEETSYNDETKVKITSPVIKPSQSDKDGSTESESLNQIKTQQITRGFKRNKARVHITQVNKNKRMSFVLTLQKLIGTDLFRNDDGNIPDVIKNIGNKLNEIRLSVCNPENMARVLAEIIDDVSKANFESDCKNVEIFINAFKGAATFKAVIDKLLTKENFAEHINTIQKDLAHETPKGRSINSSK